MKKPKNLLNNLGLKILAVLFSALLWLVAVNINDPVESKTFRNMKVEMKNTGVLTDEGKTYQVLDETDEVSVTIRASRSVLEGISESDITATADFSELSFTNTVPIRLSVNRYVENQVQEVKGNIDSLKLEVEDLIERQLVIETQQVGEPADGYIVGKISITDGNAMKISGPESVVSRVSRAVVEADLDELTDNIIITEKIKLLDAEGKEITDNRITRSVTTANVSVTILLTKEIPVRLNTMGEPAEGYVAIGEAFCKPETITIAGKSGVVRDLSEISIPAEELDLTGATADVVKLVDVKSYLPEGVSLINNTEGFNGRLTVTAQIEALVDSSRRISADRIQIQNVPEGYRVAVAENAQITVRLRGLQADLSQVTTQDLTGVVDVAAWMRQNGQTELETGEAQMQASFILPEGITLSADVMIPMTVEKTEDEEQPN